MAADKPDAGGKKAPDVVDFKNKGEAVCALAAYRRQAHPEAEQDPGAARAGARHGSDRKSALFGALFMGAVLVALAVYIVTTGQTQSLLSALSRVEAPWVWATFATMVGYLALGTLAFVCTVVLTPSAPAGLLDLCSVEAAGTFFGNLTPMMAGSVPGQIWRLLKSGLDFGAASAVQLTRFLMFQLAEIVLAGVLLALTWSWFFDRVGAVMWVNVALFGLKAAEMGGLLLVCLFPDWVVRVGLRLIAFVERHPRLGLAGRAEGWRDALTTQVAQFSATFRTAVRHVAPMGVMLVFSMAQQFCLFATPWFVLRAFGVDEGFLVTVAAGSLVQFVSSSIPLPGGTGGVEASFALFFGPMFGADATAGYLVWRLVTFYGYTALCGAATMLSTKPHSPTVRQRLRGLVGRVDGGPTPAR